MVAPSVLQPHDHASDGLPVHPWPVAQSRVADTSAPSSSSSSRGRAAPCRQRIGQRASRWLCCRLSVCAAAAAIVSHGRGGRPRAAAALPNAPMAPESPGCAAAPRHWKPPCVAKLFPTAVYRQRLRQDVADVEELNQELIAETQQYIAMDEAGHDWSDANYRGGYTSFGSLRQLHRMSSTFGKLERYINSHVRAFAKYLEFDSDAVASLAMTDCWVNLMPDGTSHGLHLHPGSTISGVYYVTTPTDCPGLRFEDPRLDRMMAAPPRRTVGRDGKRPSPRRWTNRQLVEYPARAGDVVMFESWLRHSVVPRKEYDDERLSVSFNYHWC